MNLEDLILPSSVGSPSGLSALPLVQGSGRSGNVAASAIPIKRKHPQPPHRPQQLVHLQSQATQNADQEKQLPFGSAPSHPPPMTRVANEFGYVQRHVRKTSIDERRVCC